MANDAATVDTGHLRLLPLLSTRMLRPHQRHRAGLDVNVTVTLPGCRCWRHDHHRWRYSRTSSSALTLPTVSATVPAPAADGLLTVTANVTDVAGNAWRCRCDTLTITDGVNSQDIHALSCRCWQCRRATLSIRAHLRLRCWLLSDHHRWLTLRSPSALPTSPTALSPRRYPTRRCRCWRHLDGVNSQR